MQHQKGIMEGNELPICFFSDLNIRGQLNIFRMLLLD